MKDKNFSGGRPGAIDWQKTHERLYEARSRLEQGWAPTAEEKKEILAKRAGVLAEGPPAEDTGPRLEIVEFLLAHERYGLETALVREVYPLKELTPVPCTPAHVLGIINVRGRTLSVIDLKKFFDLPEKGLGDLNKVIILSSAEMEFGILADVILGVRTLAAAALQPALSTLTGIREEYLKGLEADRTIVLDGARILADPKIIVNEEVNI